MCALLVPVFGRVWARVGFAMAVLGATLSAAASVWALTNVLHNGPIHYYLGGWDPPIGIEYVVDNISGFVAVVVSSVATLTLIATRRWVLREAGDRIGTFYCLCMLLVTGLMGMIVTGDLFNLFVFIEISSLAAYSLIFLGGRGSMIAAFRYLIIGSIGGSFYLLGVGFLYFATGTLNMADMHHLLMIDASSRTVAAGAVFIFTGLGVKMALFPLHLWLPDAYAFAPSSVNSLIAPIMTKVAAYAMIRMFISVFPDGYLIHVVPVADALLVLGALGIMYGAVVAMGQRDIRRILAYSSISQLGLIAVGIGLATPLGFIAALIHIMNHAVMKGTMFLSSAATRYRANAILTDEFSGIGRRMPVTMGAFTLAALAMVGVPPFAGFFSKWYAVQASVQSGDWIIVAVVLVSSLLSAVYLFKIVEMAYLRPAQPEPSHGDAEASSFGAPEEEERLRGTAREAPLDMLLPAAVLGIATLALGIANAAIVTHILRPGL